ncbi:MAG: Ig-like domain-containing protein [Candidatus Marinimicrobia bacterium]|nr:Ig-like domain-containing protein [Candidatus Neomarinimicrobiota bacterium]
MNKSFPKLNFLISSSNGILLLLIFIAGCAAQGPPGGGPVDKTGPVLLSTFPENGTVRVDQKTGIVLNFSETIEPRSAENNLVITPNPDRPAIVKANRKRVSIHFVEPLQENTTYILSFGRGIQDYQKNSSETNITLAFSTGDSLDSGTITGTVYDIPDKHKAQVWAYRKKESFPDSILGQSPDYKTAVEKDGRYRLMNLARGEYRLLAVSTEAAKIAYIDENCQLGIPTIDPVVVKQRNKVQTRVDFRLGKFYLKPFRLLKATMIDDKTELLFSRPLDKEQNNRADIQIDNDAQVQSFWIAGPKFETILLKARGMIAENNYTVTVQDIVDDRGDVLKQNNTATFTYIEGADTLKPEITSTSPVNGAKNISRNTKIQLVFNEALQKVVIDSSLRIISKDSVLVDYSSTWLWDNSIELSPRTQLASGMEYRLILDYSDWSDLSGNQFKDSLFTLSFSTLDANSFGSISGKVLPSDSCINRLMLSCIPEKGGSAATTISVTNTVKYTIESLLPGVYRFEMWEDLNGNGKWDPGKLKPFVPAEPYRSFPDYINVRARWETAEVDWKY